MLSFAVCEDEACFTTVLERLLHQYAESRKTGLAIQCFTDGEALLHSRQPFDAILMDIKLPGMNGTDIMRQLRDRGNRSQLILSPLILNMRLRRLSWTRCIICSNRSPLRTYSRRLTAPSAGFPTKIEGTFAVKNGRCHQIKTEGNPLL